jgi:hypothetical protein
MNCDAYLFQHLDQVLWILIIYCFEDFNNRFRVNSTFTSYFVLFVTNDLGNALFFAGTWKCNLAPRAYANACQQIIYGCQRHMEKLDMYVFMSVGCLPIFMEKTQIMQPVLKRLVECKLYCLFRALNFISFYWTNGHVEFCMKIPTNMDQSNQNNCTKYIFEKVIFKFIVLSRVYAPGSQNSMP